MPRQTDSDVDKPLAVSSRAPPAAPGAALCVSSASVNAAGPCTRLKFVVEASKRVTEQEAAAQAFAAQRQAAQAQAQAIAAQQQAAQTLSEARAVAEAVATRQQAAQIQSVAQAQALAQAQAQAQAQTQAAQQEAAQTLTEARAAAQAVAAQQQAAQSQALAQAQAVAQAAQQQAALILSQAQAAAQAAAAQQQAQAQTQAQAIDAQEQAAMPDRFTRVMSQGLGTLAVGVQQQAIPGAATKALAYDWQAYSTESPEKPGHSHSAGTASAAGEHPFFKHWLLPTEQQLSLKQRQKQWKQCVNTIVFGPCLFSNLIKFFTEALMSHYQRVVTSTGSPCTGTFWALHDSTRVTARFDMNSRQQLDSIKYRCPLSSTYILCPRGAFSNSCTFLYTLHLQPKDIVRYARRCS